MLPIIDAVIPYMFPVFRAKSLFDKATVITNSTNPVVLAKNITLTVVDLCCPPQLKVAARCVALGAFLISTATCPTPLNTGVVLHMISEIYDKCE